MANLDAAFQQSITQAVPVIPYSVPFTLHPMCATPSSGGLHGYQRNLPTDKDGVLVGKYSFAILQSLRDAPTYHCKFL
jgi:hypothetical protein